MIFFQIIEFLASFVEALLGISINAKTLGKENLKIKNNIISSFIIASSIWFMNQFWIFSIVITMIGIAGIIISSHIIYKTKILDSIVLTIFYLSLVYIVDFLSISLLGLMVKDTQFADVVSYELSWMRVYFLILDKTLLSIVYMVLEKGCLAKMQIPMRKVAVGITLIIVQIAVLIERTYVHIDLDTFFVWLFLLLLILTVLYLTVQIMSYIQNNKQLAMAMERNTLLADNYKKSIQQYQKEQVFYHDLKNQFLIIKNYLKSKDFDKAEDYIEQLSSGELQIPKQRTGIDVLDILIEYKKKEAKAQNIYVEIIADPIKLKLTEYEIVALFGNLFDNAIEACSKMQDDIKWIRIVIRRIQEMTFIKISNSYRECPVFSNNKFVSIKKPEHRIHGLGITSMKIIVEKYAGNIEVNYDSEKFVVMIAFFN